MEVIGLQVFDEGKKWARVVIVFKNAEGKIAQTSIPLSKLKFIGLTGTAANG